MRKEKAPKSRLEKLLCWEETCRADCEHQSKKGRRPEGGGGGAFCGKGGKIKTAGKWGPTRNSETSGDGVAGISREERRVTI